jgi:Na+/melibiose symporter-like transporter
LRQIRKQLVTFSLGIAGFVNPIDGVEQPQPETFLFALRFIISFVPIILLVLGIIAAFRYPLNPKRHDKLREYLEAKRENKTVKEELEKEITELKKELI